MRKRRILWVILCVFFVFAFVASSSVSSAKPITLNMTSQNPETSWGHMSAIAPWAKQVEKATKGQLKIRIYAAQTLTKGKDAWTATKSGVADLGWCFHGYWPGLTPLADVISLPALGFKTAEKGSEMLWNLYEKFPSIQKEFADNQVLLTYTSHPYMLITTDKWVKSLEDIKGLKIRMTGGPPTTQMKALGGVPMLIPMPENYISLQKGVIDGMGAPWEAIHGFRLYEVVKYYTEVPFPAVYFTIAMNKNKWNSLPKDIQRAVMSVSGLEGSKFFGRNFFDTAKDSVFQKAKEGGYPINFYTLSDSERARWLEVGGKPIWEDWVKKMENEGRTDARAILNAALDMLK